jgi:FMN phosphatase YigB (HAD superfamily)
VGDKLTEDVEGAAQVGIRTVLIDRAGTLDTEYLPRIRSLPELLDLLGEAVGPVQSRS